ANGSVVINSDGTLSYTPNANYNGSDTITYSVSDGNGGSATSSVAVTVNAVNDAPTTAIDNFSVVEGSVLSATSVLLNDTDVEGDTISVIQVASDVNGVNAVNADGTTTLTTALGGTVVMSSDGTFTYTAPVLNHTTDGLVEQDYIYYQASDGSDSSTWQRVNLNVDDTAPTAFNDTDSVGFGGSADGNVIDGLGGTGVVADTLGADATLLTSVTYNGVVYSNFDVNGNVTIDTANGTLVLNQDGTYSYDSAYAIGSVSGNNQTDWDNSGIGYYGINSGDPFDANGNLDFAVLSAANSSNVDFSNQGGLGVLGDKDDKVDKNEFIVFDLGGNASTVDVSLNDFKNNENVNWFAYNELGELVGSGSASGNAGNVINITASDFIQYIVIDPDKSNVRIDGIVYDVDSTINVSDTFTYELQDADGDVTSADLTLTHDAVPVAVSDSATVFESALSTGTDAGSGNDIATGNILTNDVGVSGTATITDINGVSADANGIITVSTANGVLVVDALSGDYTYTLTTSNQNGDNVVDSFTYTLDSNNQTTTAQLDISIVDDAPVGSDVVQNIQDVNATTVTTNLVIVLDRSGSMDYDLNGQTRMDVAKEALSAMFDSFDNLGNVNIQFVDFSSTVNTTAWYQDDLEAANGYLNSIQAGGGTYYDDALNATMNAYNSTTPPVADNTLVYFISDGEPTAGHEVDATLQADWENFLTTNSVDLSFGIGITDNVNLDSLTPIAYPDTNTNGDVEPYAIQVLDAFDLQQTLLDTVSEGIVQGDAAIVSGASTSGIVMGADGGHIDSILIDGNTYSYDAANPVQTITTVRGGVLNMNFDTGEYIYTINPQDTVSGASEVFVVTAIDGDGDTTAINLTINLDYIANVDANTDNIITNATTGDSLSVSADALTHNDNLIDNMSITNVTPAAGTDITTSATDITFTDIASGESIDYTISDGVLLDSTHADVTLQNSDSLMGTGYDDILIASRTNNNTSANNVVEAVVLSGNTYNQNNQIGFNYLASANATAIASITLDISNDPNAYFDTTGAGSTAPSMGASTVGIASSDVTYDAPDGSNTLTVNFAQGSFTQGDAFWFGVDTDRLGNDTGADYGLEGARVTITYEDGTSFGGVYVTNTDGSSSLVLMDGNVLYGNNGDDVLVGNANNELLIGGSGDDVLLGGAGDDKLVYDAQDSIINGGDGTDTLVLTGSDSIDFAQLDSLNNPISNIETIDLTNGDHLLANISLEDVLDITDANNTLEITGDSADTLSFTIDTNVWSNTATTSNGGSTTYTYSNGSDSITLTVDDQINTTGL
ncbi:beta strand repeat-containing protein, partial [Sulfurimonas sp.]